MTKAELSRETERYEAQQTADLERLKEMCSDNNTFQYYENLDFALSPYWFKVEIYTAGGRIYPHCFACGSLISLKNSIRVVLEHTCFPEAIAFVKNCSYVTFRRADNLDREFAYYYE